MFQEVATCRLDKTEAGITGRVKGYHTDDNSIITEAFVLIGSNEYPLNLHDGEQAEIAIAIARRANLFDPQVVYE